MLIIIIICGTLIYNSEAIEEIYKDARLSGLLNSANSKAASNASLALAWLEAVFPELIDFSHALAVQGSRSMGLKVHAYAPFDASVSLQGSTILARPVLGVSVVIL
eukprot:Gb_40785 [translate_table: standard]